MAVFAMVTTLCARPLMAFADGDDTYWPEGPQINSPCAVVMEVNTGTVLYEKNSHEKHYPASITKILTTYLTILNCKMDEKVTFSKEAVKESSDYMELCLSRQTSAHMLQQSIQAKSLGEITAHLLI